MIKLMLNKVKRCDIHIPKYIYYNYSFHNVVHNYLQLRKIWLYVSNNCVASLSRSEMREAMVRSYISRHCTAASREHL